MAYQGPALGKKTAQEEEDRRIAEKKKAEEEKKAAEEAARKKAEEEARARKEADMLGAQHAEMISESSGAKNYTVPAQQKTAAPKKNDSGSFFAKPNSTATQNQAGRFSRKTVSVSEPETKPEVFEPAGNAFKAASDASFMQEKKEMAEIKGKPEGMSAEEIYRLLYLDESETQKRIDELKGQRHDYGGTAAAVAAGRNSKSPMTGTAVNYDEERENEIADLERDLLLHGQIQKEFEYLDILNDPSKQAYSYAGLEKWEKDKAAEKPMTTAEAYGKVLGAMAVNGMLGNDTVPVLGDVIDVIGSGIYFANDEYYRMPRDTWSEEQKNIFGYYYYNDPEKAFEYAETVNNALDKQAKGEKLSETEELALEHPVLFSLYSVAKSGGGVKDYAMDVAEYLGRGTVTEKGGIVSDFEASQAGRGTIAEELNNKYGTLGNTDVGLGTGYSIMMSSLDSMAAAYTGGQAGALITAFGSSASAALDDALERGANAEQALGYATLVSGAELLPEYMSVDSLFKLMDAGDAWTLIGNIGKQAGVEGVEGFITAVSAQGVDDVIMGELSKFNVAVNNYMLAGYSREEAEYLARKDINSGIIFDTISEALGGGFSGGVVTGVQTAINGNRSGNASVLDGTEPTVQGKPEAVVQTEVPVPFGGNAEPGTEQGMVGDKITEIENRPISDADKAAKMDEIIKAVAETTGSPEVIAEAEMFKGIYEERAAAAEMQQETAENVAETQQEGLFGPDIIGKILGFEPVETEGFSTGIDIEEENVFGFKKYTEKQIENWKDSKRITICDTFEKIKKFVNEAISNKNNKKAYFGAVTSDLAKRIESETGINTENYNFSLGSDEIRKIFKDHGDEKTESQRGQRAITVNDVFEIPNIIKNADSIKRSANNYMGKPAIEFRKNVDGSLVTVIGVVSDKHLDLFVQTEYAGVKKGNLVTPIGEQAPINTPEANRDTVSNNIISSESDKFNPPSVGNSVFGPESIKGIFGFGENENIQSTMGQANEPTPSMKRADGKKTAEDWKGIAERIGHYWGIESFKDLPRILDIISDGDKGLRQQLYELYEKPLNEAQGSYAKEYTEKAKQITAKFKELGIKSGSKESAAVQRIGEGAREINKRGETTEYTLDDLKKDFPDSWQNIKEGADFCRKVYDEFLHDLNTMYESIYPATVAQARARISSYDMGILRDEGKIEHFREVIENLEAEKAEKQTQLSGKKPTTLIYAQLQSQIDNIDGRIAKAESIIGRLENRELVKKISRETLNAQIENGEILRNKQIKPRADYFRHFQELTNEFAEIADIFSNDQRIPPNLAGKSADTKPRAIWTSIAQSRANVNYYTEDAVGGLLRYTEIAEKLLAFDPLISHFRDVNSAIRAAGEMADNEVKGKGTNAGQFVSHMDAITNQLAGKTNPWFDRLAADYGGDAGRAVLKAVKLLNKRVKSNAILGNFRSAVVQIGNLPNATLYIKNPADWAKGAIAMLNGFERDENIKNARAQSNFMNRRYMGDAIDEVTKEIQKNGLDGKLKDFAVWMLGAGDRFGAELIWHTAYTKALNNPAVLEGRERGRAYESAIDYADDITRRSIGGRAEGDIPLAEESQIIGLVAPFQIEVTNTFNAFKEGFKDKNWIVLAALEISIFFMNNLLEGITGDRPLGLDFIQAALDIWFEATSEDDEEEEEKDFGDYWDIATYAGGRIGGELLSGMPLGAQVADWITGGDEQKAEDWFGDSDPTRYGTGNIGMDAIADTAEYFIDGETPGKLFELATDGKKNSYEEWAAPVLETVDTFAPIALPWGGKQLSRTLQGADQIIQGGAYGTEADGTEYLKFLQGDDLEDFYKVLLFGRYAGEGGQDYIDSGFKNKLTAEETKQMELAEAFGISNEDFYKTVLELKAFSKNEDKQKALLDNNELSAEEKAIYDYILFGGASYKAAENGYIVPERNYTGTEEFYISGLSDTEKRLYEQGFYGGELDRLEKAIKSGGNKGEKIENIMETLDVSETEAFEILQKRNGDWIETAEDLSEEESARASGAENLYGMSTEDYLATVNAKSFGGDSKEEIIEGLMAVNGWDRETAEENYNRVFVYEYSRDDISEERAAELDTAQDWYDVDDYGYFVARNAIKTAEGEKDKYGNTVSGSKKAAAIKAIAKELGIDEEEAAVYYLAANGDLALSPSDLSSSKQADLEEAVRYGWTERQFLDAVNVVKLSGATKKADIIAALVAAGATYEMAYGYYNLQQNNDYYKR